MMKMKNSNATSTTKLALLCAIKSRALSLGILLLLANNTYADSTSIIPQPVHQTKIIHTDAGVIEIKNNSSQGTFNTNLKCQKDFLPYFQLTPIDINKTKTSAITNFLLCPRGYDPSPNNYYTLIYINVAYGSGTLGAYFCATDGRHYYHSESSTLYDLYKSKTTVENGHLCGKTGGGYKGYIQASAAGGPGGSSSKPYLAPGSVLRLDTNDITPAFTKFQWDMYCYPPGVPVPYPSRTNKAGLQLYSNNC